MPPTVTLSKVAEVGGSLKQVQQAFQAFQVARNQFINQISGFLKTKDPNAVTMEALMKNDIMAVLCCPLAQDSVAGIQAAALGCLSKLSTVDPLLSQVIVSCGVLDSVVLSMTHESSPVQAAADGVLGSVALSSEEFAGRVISAGALQPLTQQLKSSPPEVKEAAVRTLGSIIRSSEEYATVVCDDNAVVTTMSYIAACSPQLAEALVRQNILPHLCLLVRGNNTPPDLKAEALCSLSNVAQHNEELANQVAETGVVEATVQALADRLMPPIRRNAASLLLQLSQKTPKLAEVVTANGAPSCLKQYMMLEKDRPDGILVGSMIAGSMASYKASIAMALIDAGAAVEVVNCIKHPNLDVSGTAAWSVEQMACHGEETTMPLVEKGALMHLMDGYGRMVGSNRDYHTKLKSSIKALIRGCSATGSLEAFVAESTPPELLKHFLRQLLPMIEATPKARQQFVTSGALMRLQRVLGLVGENSGLKEYADKINGLFPGDVVAYYSTGGAGPPPRG
eukprot:gene23988-9564_t